LYVSVAGAKMGTLGSDWELAGPVDLGGTLGSGEVGKSLNWTRGGTAAGAARGTEVTDGEIAAGGLVGSEKFEKIVDNCCKATRS
jgi:hypothetical protein